jgi:hypothetical protein
MSTQRKESRVLLDKTHIKPSGDTSLLISPLAEGRQSIATSLMKMRQLFCQRCVENIKITTILGELLESDAVAGIHTRITKDLQPSRPDSL